MPTFAVETSVNGGEYVGGITIYRAKSIRQIDDRKIEINGEMEIQLDDSIESISRATRGGWKPIEGAWPAVPPHSIK